MIDTPARDDEWRVSDRQLHIERAAHLCAPDRVVEVVAVRGLEKAKKFRHGDQHFLMTNPHQLGERLADERHIPRKVDFPNASAGPFHRRLMALTGNLVLNGSCLERVHLRQELLAQHPSDPDQTGEKQAEHDDILAQETRHAAIPAINQQH